jgi:hypothetical protein
LGSRVAFVDGLTKSKFHHPSFGAVKVPLQVPSGLAARGP